jgi:tRNA dimethylallyltransferase
VPLIVIVGATGTGKSELSLDVAERLGATGVPAEIVNADAMQLYRGMDVGTAKLPEAERRGIPHHMLDVLDPIDDASVADYQADARAVIEAIEARGSVPILVGGSGLYVSSVIQDFRFPGTDAEIRARLEAELEVLGPGQLHRRLADRDPAAADAIGPYNGRRLVRALEVIEITGEEFGSGLPENGEPWRENVTIALSADRDELVPRLDERVRRMWSSGMLDEVRELSKGGLGVTASRVIGYAQAIAQLAGEIDEATAIEQTAALTRRYARRQVGWFRRYRDAHWLQYDDPGRASTAVRLAMGQN